MPFFGIKRRREEKKIAKIRNLWTKQNLFYQNTNKHRQTTFTNWMKYKRALVSAQKHEEQDKKKTITILYHHKVHVVKPYYFPPFNKKQSVYKQIKC